MYYKCMLRLSVSKEPQTVFGLGGGAQFVVVSGSWQGYIRRLNPFVGLKNCSIFKRFEVHHASMPVVH